MPRRSTKKQKTHAHTKNKHVQATTLTDPMAARLAQSHTHAGLISRLPDTIQSLLHTEYFSPQQSAQYNSCNLFLSHSLWPRFLERARFTIKKEEAVSTNARYMPPEIKEEETLNTYGIATWTPNAQLHFETAFIHALKEGKLKVPKNITTLRFLQYVWIHVVAQLPSSRGYSTPLLGPAIFNADLNEEIADLVFSESADTLQENIDRMLNPDMYPASKCVRFIAKAHWLIVHDHVAALKALILQTYPEKALPTTKYKKESLAFTAARYNRLEALILLIQHHAEIDGRHQYLSLFTPLLMAMHCDHDAVFKRLLEVGARVNAEAKVVPTPTALFFAIAQGKVEIVRLLLEKNADPSLCRTPSRYATSSPLSFAEELAAVYPSTYRTEICVLLRGPLAEAATTAAQIAREKADAEMATELAELASAANIQRSSSPSTSLMLPSLMPELFSLVTDAFTELALRYHMQPALPKETIETNAAGNKMPRACPQFARSPQKSLILEHRSGVYIEVNEQRSTENQGFMQDIVELRTRPTPPLFFSGIGSSCTPSLPAVSATSSFTYPAASSPNLYSFFTTPHGMHTSPFSASPDSPSCARSTERCSDAAHGDHNPSFFWPSLISNAPFEEYSAIPPAPPLPTITIASAQAPLPAVSHSDIADMEIEMEEIEGAKEKHTYS